MARDYEPAEGIGAFASGTPPVLALSALEAALEEFDGVSVADLRARSLALTDLFISLVEERLPGVFEIVTPREHDRRGSQVSLRHGAAYGVVQALIAREVIGDFRDPDIARFGFAPLYNTPADVRTAVERLVLVMANDEHLDPAYAVRNPSRDVPAPGTPSSAELQPSSAGFPGCPGKPAAAPEALQDLPHQLGGLGRRLADLDPGRLEGLLLGLRRCRRSRRRSRRRGPWSCPRGR